jgi:hypothetical protein
LKEESSNIKFDDHFKLYVLLKDKILFEATLLQNGIDFYFEENQPMISSGIRYFLRDIDRGKIDDIIIKNEIIASVETIPTDDYRDVQKGQKLYLYVAIIVIVLMLIIILVDSF